MYCTWKKDTYPRYVRGGRVFITIGNSGMLSWTFTHGGSPCHQGEVIKHTSIYQITSLSSLVHLLLLKWVRTLIQYRNSNMKSELTLILAEVGSLQQKTYWSITCCCTSSRWGAEGISSTSSVGMSSYSHYHNTTTHTKQAQSTKLSL